MRQIKKCLEGYTFKHLYIILLKKSISEANISEANIAKHTIIMHFLLYL